MERDRLVSVVVCSLYWDGMRPWLFLDLDYWSLMLKLFEVWSWLDLSAAGRDRDRDRELLS